MNLVHGKHHSLIRARCFFVPLQTLVPRNVIDALVQDGDVFKMGKDTQGPDFEQGGWMLFEGMLLARMQGCRYGNHVRAYWMRHLFCLLLCGLCSSNRQHTVVTLPHMLGITL